MRKVTGEETFENGIFRGGSGCAWAGGGAGRQSNTCS